MASFLDKLKVKTALDSHVGLDLSCQHISTANFMQLNVAWAKELVPKEKISVNMETFTRLAPMPVPTFGRGKINNRAFFVPFRTIFPAWNDFITDAVHVYANGQGSGIVTTVPTVSNYALVSQLINSTYVEYDKLDVQASAEEKAGADFVLTIYNLNGHDVSQKKYIKLNYLGRQYKKIIESLGYKITTALILDEDDPNDFTYAKAANDSAFGVFSALPLLALLKVYHDWYFPSAYSNTGVSEMMEKLCKYDSSTPLELDGLDLINIFDFVMTVNYDSDYFVSAWDNPTNPTNGQYSNFKIVDPSNGTTQSYNRVVTSEGNTANGKGAPILNNGSNGVSAVTQWAIDALKSMTDYMKRHQLVGARALDRYLARFGVALTAEKLNRSVYIGSQTQNLQFGDVMSTANTDTAALGDYAGKGVSYGDGNFEFETDEYGMMIIVSSIVPQIGYYEGVDRNVMHITKLDYYTPEFDNLGTQAISKYELKVPNYKFMSIPSDYSNSMKISDVFGWTPRYAEYKVGRDRLTGDFALPSLRNTNSAWHLMREFTSWDKDDIKHDLQFVQGNDANQYSRIFYNTDAEAADKFNVIYNFNIKSWSPMKSLFDTYEFDSKGKEVVEDVNGVKMN